MECMDSTYAQAAPVGYLTKWEVEQLAKDGAKQLNDFGRCAYIANHTYNVRMGYVRPEGIYNSCAWNG